MVTDKILAALSKGTIPWQRPWRPADAQRSINGHVYRGMNQFLLQLEVDAKGYTSPFWMTFEYASEHGWQVRKGEHATQVLLAKKVAYRDPDAEEGEGALKTFFSLRYYYVFNPDQVDGIEKLPTLPVFPEIEPLEECESIVKAMPNAPKIGHGGDAAYYDRRADKVQMPPRKAFQQVQRYYSTLFHELGHSTGHPSRLGRHQEGDPVIFGSKDYSKEELVAEMCAAFVCGHAGIDTDIDQSAAYIKSWSQKLADNPRWLVSAASAAQKAADYILNQQTNYEFKEDEE
jgi:antirestriction protein ArdC